MPHAVRSVTRPLTSAERGRIADARRKVEQARRDLDAAERERDLAILEAYRVRGNVGELADAAGVARQTIHTIVKRLERDV